MIRELDCGFRVQEGSIGDGVSVRKALSIRILVQQVFGHPEIPDFCGKMKGGFAALYG